MSTVALATRDTHALEPTGPRDALDVAIELAKSGLFPHLANPGAVFAVMAKGRELGLPMMTALTDVCIIKGKIQLSAAAMMAVCLGKGAAEYFAMVESTPERATYRTKRKGDQETRHTFSIQDAQQMGLAGLDQYKKQPATMLRWRCVAALARMVYPDVLAGCYTPDEIGDIEPVRVASTAVTLPQGEKPASIEEVIAAADTAAKLDDLAAKIAGSKRTPEDRKAHLKALISTRRKQIGAGDADEQAIADRGTLDHWTAEVRQTDTLPALHAVIHQIGAAGLSPQLRRELHAVVRSQEAKLGGGQ